MLLSPTNQTSRSQTLSDFRQLSPDVWASPQIEVEDVETARKMGIAMIINNRPDDESEDQTPGASIEKAAIAAGLAYCAIPISHGGFNEPQVDAMRDALERSGGKTLAYCRSGTRSTLLWALAQSVAGEDAERLTQQAAQAGYDLSPVRAAMVTLAARSGE